MAQLRNFQFLRNNTIGTGYENHAAVVAALLSTQDNPLANVTAKDGELVLYRYKLNDIDSIHTMVLVAHVAKGSGNTSFEIIANYDQISSELQSSIDAINNKINDMDFSDASTGSEYVKVNVTQVDGAITGVTVDTTTLVTKITALEAKDTELANAIAANTTAIGTNTTAIAANGELIAANATAIESLQGEDERLAGLIGDNTDAIAELQARSNTYEAGKGIAIDDDTRTIAADLTLAYDETTKKITLTGANEGVFGEIDATDFIVDGMLSDAAVITATTEDQAVDENVVVGDKYIKLTFITKYHNGENTTQDVEKVVYVAAKSLVDVYTADEVYLTVSNNKFSHKTSGVTASRYGIVEDVTVNSTAQATFKVPALTVDAAGHVTTASEKTVEIKLPASIDSAVQTINGHTVNNSYITTTVTPSEGGKTQSIEVTANFGRFADNSKGFAEATEVKGYVDTTAQTLRQEMAALPHENTITTVVAGNGITVTEVTGDGDKNYQVALAKKYTANEEGVVNVPTVDTDEQSFADDTNGLHVIKAVKVDEEGRVAGIEYMTIVENFDAGTY